MRSKYLGINVFKIRRKNQFWTFMLDTPLFLCLHHLDAKWENFFCPRVLSQIFRLCFKGQNALKVFWRQLRAKYPAESFMLDFSLIRHPSVYESRLDPGKRWKWLKILHCCNTQTHTDTHMCAGSCWCDLSRVREETRSLSVQSNHQVCIPPALQPWKQREKRKPGVQRFLSPFLSRYSGMVFLLLPIHGGGKVKGRDRLHFSVSPALAVGEAQVHAVTGEEGASIQRELHAGWVWDGLTQQGHDSACRGRRRAAAKGTNVACAVEDLEKEGEEFKAEFINQARFKQPK